MRPPGRIVCLVPSLTETLFDLGAGERILGVSDYCEAPAVARSRLARVGGPKTPNHAAIVALSPDLIILGEEECCRSDFEQFTRFSDVYVATCRSVADGLEVVLELGRRLAVPAIARSIVARIDVARASSAEAIQGRSVSVFYPLWPDPWITVSARTFVADMLACAGARSIFADRCEAYPVVDLNEAGARDPGLLLLPDEPYPFTADDVSRFGGFSAVARGAVRCVPGRWAAWYGSRMDEGLVGLRRAMAEHTGGRGPSVRGTMC
jgi:ABC-type Fe3+-hydroxamate transport system substrate-binding protein